MRERASLPHQDRVRGRLGANASSITMPLSAEGKTTAQRLSPFLSLFRTYLVKSRYSSKRRAMVSDSVASLGKP